MSDDPADSGPLIEHDPTVVFAPGGSDPVVQTSHQLIGAFRYGLVVEGGPTSGLSYVLGDGSTLVGRSNESAIFLGDVSVSREHARFQIDSDGLEVIDLASTNGTYVNGERVGQSRLNTGDEVMIGRFRLRVTSGSAVS